MNAGLHPGTAGDRHRRAAPPVEPLWRACLLARLRPALLRAALLNAALLVTLLPAASPAALAQGATPPPEAPGAAPSPLPPAPAPAPARSPAAAQPAPPTPTLSPAPAATGPSASTGASPSAVAPDSTRLAPTPITPAQLAELLARPLAATVTTPATRGELDLKGRRFYIAEYRVLVEHAGEQPVPLPDGQLMGQPVQGSEAVLQYRSKPDVAAVQALVDRGWQDLQARLAAAGVTPTPAAELITQHGAIHETTEPGTSAERLVESDGRSGAHLRRYLAFSPQGMKLVKPAPGGLGVGDLVARLAYRNQKVEALSLTLAINLSALEPPGRRRSSYTAPPGPHALSPMMELGPAPSAALVYAHGQLAHVNLTEAFALAPEFGRLRLAELGESGPRSALDKLLDMGRSLTSGHKRVEAVLELDGAPMARMLLYCLGAANQAITDALVAATR